jgi:hypothetical protein
MPAAVSAYRWHKPIKDEFIVGKVVNRGAKIWLIDKGPEIRHVNPSARLESNRSKQISAKY